MKILLSILIILIVFFFYIRFLESTSVFYPSKFFVGTPDAIGLPFEDIYFETSDGVILNGWFVKGLPSLKDGPLVTLGQSPEQGEGQSPEQGEGQSPEQGEGQSPSKAQNSGPVSRTTLLFFHGNAGNIGDRLGRLELFFHMGFKNIFIVDYRGYGQSHGRPSEAGIYKDAVAAYDYLLTRSDVDSEGIVAYGASLGGAVAVDLVLQRKVGALIVDSSFTSARDMAKLYYPFVPGIFLQIKLDSLAKIQKAAVPTLFIHSADDTTVPIELGRRLFEVAPEPKQFLQIRGGHDDSHIFDQKNYIEGVTRFINNHIKNERSN